MAGSAVAEPDRTGHDYVLPVAKGQSRYYLNQQAFPSYQQHDSRDGSRGLPFPQHGELP